MKSNGSTQTFGTMTHINILMNRICAHFSGQALKSMTNLKQKKPDKLDSTSQLRKKIR